MIRVDKIIPGGEALGTAKNGKKIFFWNALPGETVTKYQTTKIKPSFERAIATKVANQSPHRISPKDWCYLSTSPWQIMNYDYELSLKQDLVVEIFREHQIEINKPGIITDGNPYLYRNKMEYALYWDQATSKIRLAFHVRGSHAKVPITNSSIERPEIFTAAKQIVTDLNSRGEEARKYQSLLLRCNQIGQISGGLFENGKPHPAFKNLTDKILDHEYSYSPNGFFQINLPVYELALKEIKKYITTDKVLDLYAGVGTIGLSVARDKHLTLVECDKSAYAELVRNCQGIINEDPTRLTRSGKSEAPPITMGRSERVRIDDGLAAEKNDVVRSGNILAILAKSEEVTDYITPDTTIILDPPRAGCETKLINRLLEIKPPKIIYLSCNPATQARDIKSLLGFYKIEQIKTFNFFPRTPHIENLVVLSL
ncbi:class I SAM-dependent RNA methyltransferase [Candidatus Saccharibacteria bacterium]|nr:class I SAM-dependent RNA methyltransferase [Candidatus Saccharibacteria bacterium]